MRKLETSVMLRLTKKFASAGTKKPIALTEFETPPKKP